MAHIVTPNPGPRADALSRGALARGAVAGLAAGALCGIVGRLVMRILAVVAGAEPGFSLRGTLTILVVGLLGGAIAGVAFVGVREYLPGPDPIRGATYGLILYLATIPLLPPSLRAEAVALPGVLPLALVLFGAAYVLSGVLLAVVHAASGRRGTDSPRTPATV